MSIKGVEGIKIDYETADRIALAVLKDDYLMVRDNIRNIEKQMKNDNYPHYVAEDLKNDKKILKGIKRVLKYHMTDIEYNLFIEENR